MKVLFVGLRAIEGKQGGIETHVRTMVRTLSESHENCKITVVERKRFSRAPNRSANFNTVQLWSPKHPALETIVHSFLAILYAAIRRPDILHIHGIGPSLFAPLARLFGLVVVCTHHGEDFRREKWGCIARSLLKLGERFAVIFANRCIAIGPESAKRLSTQFGKEVSYIPNPIPNETQENCLKVEDKFGLSGKKFLIQVGRIVPEKRQLELVNAFKELHHLDLALVLVGGVDHQSHYARTVKMAAASDSRIVFTGELTPGEILGLLELTSGFILPSSHEGLPLSLLEAMKSGANIAVSDIPNLKAIGLPATCYFACNTLGGIKKAILELSTKRRRDHDWHELLSGFEAETVSSETYKIYCAALSKKAKS